MNSYGNCVQVSHGTADDGHRYDSLYAHMSSIAVAQGAAVQKATCSGMWATPAMSTARAAGIICTWSCAWTAAEQTRWGLCRRIKCRVGAGMPGPQVSR